MILYFSATGNCRYVAEHIAHDIGDTAVSIEKHCGKIQLMQNEMLYILYKQINTEQKRQDLKAVY